MTSRRGRVLLPVLLGLALPAAAAFLVYSVTHLISSATTFHVRVVAPAAGTTLPTTAAVDRLQADQNHWAIVAMFAVAIFAGCLVLTLVTWLLGNQQRRADRR